MPAHGFGQSRHNFSVYGSYEYVGEGWGLTAGLGGSWEGHVERDNFFIDADQKEQDFYQAGINLTFGNFAFGVAAEYYNDLFDRSVSGLAFDNSTDSWVLGVGASYTMDAWTFGAQYSHREDDIDADVAYPSENIDFTQDRAVLTALYRLGPGIVVDGELAYTWNDADPEEFVNTIPNDAADYGGFELGIGTAITF
jgi:predicted porin